ncbi:GNAT family N-acetyltransferase [Streptomyces stelliscabiei]|uniref:GNAT family N-acetyltransferase n=1 Tax=Streptomyces stelliscabiei TaxID=146820 RepID=UPI0029A1FE61|nr:GNAT family N-acetyltransferase [Streptomyces stelliscabiei]MDX2661096.1 GNAT family N-acetyltransferase [Streptomyces stelliscabiei]MDX2715963.1 GNAT family N-acetyltransferase [Streptomyces stelliscabiei]MDX2790073.1 GNAT family N-acetyltransferase [Streptomyces stelliscabiei]
MLSTTIKRATMQDADRLTRLIHSCGAYRGPYASIISGYRVTADYIARHRVFVAVDETERLQGFYALLLTPPELDLAFVADDVQGSGLGRLLIKHIITQARAAGLTEVLVVSHPPAEEFYRRLGAVRVGTVAPSPPKVDWERPELRFTTT